MAKTHTAKTRNSLGGSIARRLIFWVILCSSMITFVATGLQLYLEYDRDVDNINLAMRQIQDVHISSLSNSVWVSNDTQIILQLEGLARLPDMEYLGISVDGEVKWSAGTRASRYVVTVEQPMIHDYYGKRVLIGNLQVVASLEGIYARLWNKALVILLSNGVKTFLVAVFMFLLFQYLVTRHLRKLAEHVRNTDIRRQDPPLRLERRASRDGGQDELDDVTSAVNRMQANLHQAMEKLLLSEERYRSVVATAHDGFWVTDGAGRLTEVNDAYVLRSGYSREELLSMKVSDLDMHDDEALVAARIQRLQLSGSDLFVSQHRTKSGETWDVEVSISYVEIEGGIFFCFLRDITERKRTETALRESERQKRLIFETVPDLIWLKDIEGKYLACNKMFERFFGASEADIVGKTDYDFVDADLADFFRIHDKAAMDADRPLQNEEWITFLADGSEVLLETTKTLLRNDSRTVLGVLGIGRDITGRKAMENQLLQAQKMETVGQLTGGVAHDFNNLLQVVETSLELAKDKIQKGSEAEELVDSALRAGHRGAKLTQQLLAFSRKQTLHPENLDARSLIDGMSSLLARTLGEDISIKTQFADGVANVIVDENGLTNVLLNLAVNAKAAMPKGGALTVAVSKRYFDTDLPIENDVLPAGKYVEIAVSDTGCGMSGESLSHAFEPFFTTKNVGEGSGLGLSMVYGFARQSGGNVTIESELAKGTTVRLVFPAADGEIVSTCDTQTAQKDVKHAIKVLLVEDDADVRATTLMVLKSLGCELVEAEDAAPVIGILEQDDSIELLISDVVLPGGKNGIELAQEAVRLRPDLKVILVSGYSEGSLEKSGLKEAGFRLLNKPFSKDALSEALGLVMAQ